MALLFVLMTINDVYAPFFLTPSQIAIKWLFFMVGFRSSFEAVSSCMKKSDFGLLLSLICMRKGHAFVRTAWSMFYMQLFTATMYSVQNGTRLGRHWSGSKSLNYTLGGSFRTKFCKICQLLKCPITSREQFNSVPRL